MKPKTRCHTGSRLGLSRELKVTPERTQIEFFPRLDGQSETLAAVASRISIQLHGSLSVRLAVLLGCVCGWAGESRAADNPGVTPREIVTFGEFYGSTPERAQQGEKVRIKGVVLCYDAGWNQLYVHDGNETAWLSPQQFQVVEAGMQVELTGATTLSQGRVIFTNLQLQVLGQGALPDAKQLEIPQLGTDLGQWVETRGRIRVAETSSGRLGLVVQDKRQTCLVYVMGLPATNDFKWLQGANVRIRGINASKTAEGRLVSSSVYAAGLNEVVVIEQPRTDSNAAPVTSIESLLNRELGDWTNDLVHVRGIITAYKPGESVIIKDVTASIRAQVIQTTQAQVDEPADLFGYLSVGPGETVLRGAYFELRAPAPKVPAIANQPNPEPPDSGRELSRSLEISRLRPEDAARGYRVRLKGVVTYADPDWRVCFVQDPLGAIYVDLNQRGVTAGQWVEVVGQTSSGGFAPEVVNATITILGTTNLPAPVGADLRDLADGHLDAHWVQMDGVVRRVTEQWGHLTLAVTTSKGQFRAIIPGYSGQALPTNLVDALVSIQGACTSEMNSRKQMVGVTLQTPSLQQVVILEAAPLDPFQTRATPISAVARFDPDRLAGRRLKIGGCITAVLPGQGFFVQDDSGGIRVNGAETSELKVGDSISVLGFPSIGDYSPGLEEASFRRNGSVALPRPGFTTAEEILLQGTNDAMLVELEAQLVQSVTRSAHPKLVLQSGSVVFTATLLNPPEDRELLDFPVGSLLRLVGVCSIQGGEGHLPDAFRVLVAKPGDILLLSTPPWWTIRQSLILLGGLGVGVLFAWAWIKSLRRQVHRQTEVIRRNQEELMALSRRAGMAEVATEVLHNVGNVLNSVNVSVAVATNHLRRSRTGNLARVADLLKEHGTDLGRFMTEDPKGRQVPGYLEELSQHLAAEQSSALAELESLTEKIQHINEIVAHQQNHARTTAVIETLSVIDLVEEALRMNLGDAERHKIQVLREFGPAPSPIITIEKHKALQILVNLLSNAKNACLESDQPEKRLTARINNRDDRVQILITDNGVGIPSENLTRIFAQGFTTRKNGHGFGLHSSANAAKEMGGSLTAHSEGVGRGATFTLELPLTTGARVEETLSTR